MRLRLRLRRGMAVVEMVRRGVDLHVEEDDEWKWLWWWRKKGPGAR